MAESRQTQTMRSGSTRIGAPPQKTNQSALHRRSAPGARTARKSAPLRIEKRLRPVVSLGRYRVGPLPRNRVVPFRRNQEGPFTRNPATSTQQLFVHTATAWFEFLGRLAPETSPPSPFDPSIAAFEHFMREDQGLAITT